jgi:hypothetical protein
MASRAMQRPELMELYRGCCFDDLAAVVVAAILANMVGTLVFAAIRAFHVADRFESVVRSPHVAP